LCYVPAHLLEAFTPRRTVQDTRVGGVSNEWVQLPEGVKRLMLIPDRMLKCVAFAYASVNGEKRPAGTVFLGAIPFPHYPERGGSGLLMTARHVIAGIEQYGDDGMVHVRFNTRDGASVWKAVPTEHWFQIDSAVDFSVTSWTFEPGANVDMIAWSLGAAVATAETIRSEAIGIGDEVFAVGLFRNHLGRERNEPIVRVGNIAAIPQEPIATRFGNMRAILIEARSIGGLSGCPVFVHMGFVRPRKGQLTQAGIEDPFFFLGLMHGHWEASADIEDLLTETGEPVNTGIGLVVPADEIMRVLKPFIEEGTKMREDQIAKENAPVEDSGFSDDDLAATRDLMGKLFGVSGDEADEVHRQHDQP
jgi:hypothetical protein